MHKLYDLKDMLIEELEHQTEKGLTRENLDVIDTLAHAGKNVCRLIDDCEKGEGASYGMPDGSYYGMGSYRNSYAGPWSGGANGREGAGMSGARGRMRASRDSMGRYSGEAGYSRGSEYSERLKAMAMNLPENFRGEILRMSEELKSME